MIREFERCRAVCSYSTSTSTSVWATTHSYIRDCCLVRTSNTLWKHAKFFLCARSQLMFFLFPSPFHHRIFFETKCQLKRGPNLDSLVRPFWYEEGIFRRYLQWPNHIVFLLEWMRISNARPKTNEEKQKHIVRSAISWLNGFTGESWHLRKLCKLFAFYYSSPSSLFSLSALSVVVWLEFIPSDNSIWINGG